MFRRSAAVVVALAVTLGATACQPEPTPTPTGPAFASEDEAFAAAEETYRAYVDALNQVDLSDPETFEAVYAWTTGELNASDRKGLSEYHANGVRVSGSSEIRSLEPSSYDAETPTVELNVCLDVSNVALTSAAGESLVDPNRVNVQSLTVTVVAAEEDAALMKVASIGPREGGPLCTQ